MKLNNPYRVKLFFKKKILKGGLSSFSMSLLIIAFL